MFFFGRRALYAYTEHVFLQNVAAAYGAPGSYLIVYIVYMRASKGSRPGTPEPPKDTSTVILLLGTVADTTWRMFVPTLTGIVGGFFLDKNFGTTPWLFALGTTLGCIAAGRLIKKQLEQS